MNGEVRRALIETGFTPTQAEAIAAITPDWSQFATKDDLEGLATKDDLKGLATKTDLESMELSFQKEIVNVQKDVISVQKEVAGLKNGLWWRVIAPAVSAITLAFLVYASAQWL